MHKNKWSKKIWPDSSLILCKLWIAKGLVWILLHCFTLFENYSKCRIWILAFSTKFCPIKVDLSGNTVWPQASVFQNLAKMDHFWHFQWTFVHSKCKRSSLRSQCWKRHYLWFSNTVRSQKRPTWFVLETPRRCFLVQSTNDVIFCKIQLHLL